MLNKAFYALKGMQYHRQKTTSATIECHVIYQAAETCHWELEKKSPRKTCHLILKFSSISSSETYFVYRNLSK